MFGAIGNGLSAVGGFIGRQLSNKRNYTLLGGTASLSALVVGTVSGVNLGWSITEIILVGTAATAPLGYSIWKNRQSHKDATELDKKNIKSSGEITHVQQKRANEYEDALGNIRQYSKSNMRAMSVGIFFNLCTVVLQIAAQIQDDGTDEQEGPQYTATATATLSLIIYLVAHNYYARQIRQSIDLLDEESRELDRVKQTVINLQEYQRSLLVKGSETYIALLNHFRTIYPDIDEALHEMKDTENQEALPDFLKGLTRDARRGYIGQLDANEQNQQVNGGVDDENNEYGLNL